MESGTKITAAVFAAYLRCPTEARLLTRGEMPSDTFFSDIREKIAAAQRAKSEDRRLFAFSELVACPEWETASILIDSNTSYLEASPTTSRTKRRSKGVEPGHDHVPVLYSPWGNAEESDRLLLAFCALAIAQATGCRPPLNGRIMPGCNGHMRSLRLANHFPKARQVVEAIASERTAEEPAPVLNRHCQVCDFQPRCWAIATKREDLSLLGNMTAKERAKCSEKGITTITQLSYGYRPRRRRMKQHGPPPVRHDHKLKALAIKKAQIHVVGSPELSMDGTPVFIDVEGMPDRDFHYLIGLRYSNQGEYVERSFWADRREDERGIWQEFLTVLRGIETPRLVHYGAYESRFLKLMRNRWRTSDDDAEFIDRVIDGSVNLLAAMYGRIYFPTYSNSLKEIARWLGFEWTLPRASGGQAMLLRRCWELTSDDGLRKKLIEYNIADCRAAELVTDAMRVICASDGEGHSQKLQTVNTGSLEVPFQRTFGKFPSAFPEFEPINAAAYWDYQRSKVYVRTDKLLRRNARKAEKPTKHVVVEKEVMLTDRPERCPKCGHSKLWRYGHKSHLVFDLKFTSRGVRRWNLRYCYTAFRCSKCRGETTFYSGNRTKYGPAVRAYVIYLLIELRLSIEKVREHLATVFRMPILGSKVHSIKEEMAAKYEPTYRAILHQIATGPVVHADETKAVVYGGGHYVWIFANVTSVAYVYSPSREASILDGVLAGFNGVLVSDFYAGYDGMGCQQQKCLIHLIRDINEEVLKHPFNEELSFIAQRLGILLRQIVDTIDRYGLKKFHLGKHKRSADQFLVEVSALRCVTEAGAALKKRIEKNNARLFTFLNHDGVPWNNNNAEHAVRAFTRLRNAMVTSTPKGTTDYCILLSLQQTLRCSAARFWDTRLRLFRRPRVRWLRASGQSQLAAWFAPL
jgi:predicted RecB family nuclease